MAKSVKKKGGEEKEDWRNQREHVLRRNGSDQRKNSDKFGKWVRNKRECPSEPTCAMD